MSEDIVTYVTQGIGTATGRLKPDALSFPRFRLPIILVALIVAFSLPEEFSCNIGDLRITAARAILIVISPYVIPRFFTCIIGKSTPLAISDISVFVAGIWMIVAVGITQGFEKAVPSAGVIVLEFTMSYLAGRTLAMQDWNILVALRAVCLSISVVALLSPLDTISGSFAVHNWAGSLTGYNRIAQFDYRMGFLRASGTFEHPILLGPACTVSILLSSVLPNLLRWAVRFSCFIGLILSYSAAPLMGLLIGLGLLAYGRMFRSRARWSFLFWTILAMVAAISATTNNPLGFIMSNLTFDPGSAYYRTLIWHYGGEALMNSPVFGIGLETEWFREDWMSKSVDAFLLASAMSFGIPGAILIVLTWIAPAAWPSLRSTQDNACISAYPDLRTTMNIVFVVIFFIGMTVHFWGNTWMLFSLLAGLRASLGARATSAPGLRPSYSVSRA